MEEEISLVELFNILKKRIGLIINMVLVGLILSAVYTFFIATPEYSATSEYCEEIEPAVRSLEPVIAEN